MLVRKDYMTKGTKLKTKSPEPKAVVFTLVVTTQEDITQPVVDELARSISSRLHLGLPRRFSIFHENKRLLFDPNTSTVFVRSIPAEWGEPVVKTKPAAKKRPKLPPQVRPSKKST